MIDRLQFIENTEDYCVVNKPVGIAVQGENESLIWQLNQQSPEAHYYPVHRLDKGTSGALIMARTQRANQILSAEFQAQNIAKFYLAISDKKPSKKQGRIIGDMEKSRRGAYKLLRSKNNPASTAFVSFSMGEGRRLFLIRLYSGKTHQARVALKAIGAPILGDSLYGGSEADRLYLHAWRIEFRWGDALHSYFAPIVDGNYFKNLRCQELIEKLIEQGRGSWPELLVKEP